MITKFLKKKEANVDIKETKVEVNLKEKNEKSKFNLFLGSKSNS